VLAADIDATTLVARGRLPIRQLKNAFSAQYEAAERAGAGKEALEAIFKAASLRQAALDGDVEGGKPEAGQSAGLIDEILPAAEVVRRLAAELDAACRRLGASVEAK
jgi:enoyl-[acyl-carrier protein] reductase II